jgi:hypothetical protein
MTRAEAARTILGIPLFNELMNGLEQASVDQAVNSKYDDHEARQAHLAQVRAIRDLRSRLTVISEEDQVKARKKAPA